MLRMAVENTLREEIAKIRSIKTWMYNAARNCTMRRVGSSETLLFSIVC